MSGSKGNGTKENPWLLKTPPGTAEFEAYRDAFYHMRFPPLGSLAYLTGVSLALLVIGQWVFGRLEGKLAEEL